MFLTRLHAALDELGWLFDMDVTEADVSLQVLQALEVLSVADGDFIDFLKVWLDSCMLF